MKVLLVHIDGKLPNLALMKISAWHKAQGNKVSFDMKNPDKVYISCVFRQNRSIALGISKMFNCPVEVGGPGVNLESKLPDEIEHMMPDYSLYHVQYSMGFTSRGCIRSCPWCIVPKKEGKIRDHALIKEFLAHKKVILFDGNFLASPKWKENLEFIIQHRLEVNFNQGLDIRLIDNEKASWLSKVKAKTSTFKTDMLHFAFDDVAYEKQVRHGVEVLETHGIKPYKLTFYFLCGFYEPYDFQEDMYRFKVLRELGVNPYCMVYNNRKDISILSHFERWVNTHPPIYKVCDFKNYNRLKH